MHEILDKRTLNPDVTELELEAPLVASKIKPGQFLVIRMHEKSERIPLTVYKKDKEAGSVRIIFQKVGKSTYELDTYEPGDELLDVIGPLGSPSPIEYYGKVVCVGGGVGTPEIFPVARALKEEGNDLTVISGFKTEDLVICEEAMEKVCTDGFHVATDDGSYGREGFTTDVLEDVIDEEDIDLVHAAGPVPMMKAISEMTEERDIPTRVSLNPIMVDATGMCGSCRVNIGGERKLACVDGPEFDAHKVDFEDLLQRIDMFEKQEEEAIHRWKEEHQGGCDCES